MLGTTLIGVFFWATSEGGSHRISEELRGRIREQTGLDISFDRLEVELFPPRIRVIKVRALHSEFDLSCTAEETEFAPDALAFFRGALAIDEVYVGQPFCRGRLNQKQVEALRQKLDRSGSGDEPFDVGSLPEFDTFAVSDAGLDLALDDIEGLGDLRLGVKGLGLDVTGESSRIVIRGLWQRVDVGWDSEDGQRHLEESAEGLRFRAALQNGGVDVSRLRVRAPGLSVAINDGHVPFPVFPAGPQIADLSIELGLDAAQRLPLDLPQLYGTVSYHGQLSVAETAQGELAPTARGRLVLGKVSVGDYVVGDLDGLFALSQDGVSFAQTEIRTADGMITASGDIKFDEELTTRVDAQLERVELARLLEQVTVSDSHVVQRMSGRIHMEGGLDPFRISGPVDLEVEDHQVFTQSFRAPAPPKVLELPRVEVKGNVVVAEKFISGRDLTVSCARNSLRVSMRFDLPNESWWLEADAPDFYLSDVGGIAGFKLAGRGPLKARIQGLLSNPRIKGHGKFEGFAFETFSADRLETDVDFYDSVLAFENATADLGTGHIKTPRIGFDFSGSSDLVLETDAKLENVSIERLARALSVDIADWGEPSGSLNGRVKVGFTSGEQEHFLVDARVRHEQLVIGKEGFGPDVLAFRYEDGSLLIEELGLPKGSGIVTVTGRVEEDRTLALTAIATGIPVGAIEQPQVKELNLRATAQAFATIGGTLDHPRAKAKVRLSEAAYAGGRYGPSRVDLVLDDRLLTGRGSLAGGVVLLKHGSVDLRDGSYRLEGLVDRLELLGLLDSRPRGGKGQVVASGEVAVSGVGSSLESLSGFAEIKEIQVEVDQLSFRNDDPLRLDVRKGRIVVGKTDFSGRDVNFNVGGFVGPQRVDVRARGTAGLASIASIVDGLEKTEGRLELELLLKGRLENPRLTGKAELLDGRLKVAEFPYPIEKIYGEIELLPRVVRFVRFRAEAAGGKLEAEGELRLARGDEPIDYVFFLRADALDLSLIKDLRFEVSTMGPGLVLRAPSRGGLPTVTGDVELSDLRFTHDIRVLELSELSVDKLSGIKTHTSRPKLVDEAGDIFAFDIGLHGDTDLQARNNLFDVTLEIDDRENPLRLVGTNQSIGFLGRIYSRDGTVRFAGKRFEVTYGLVEFRDADRPENPYFRVTADGQVRDWRITLTAEGTVDEYELRFASQPYLPKEDIVFVILTGLTRAENRQFGGGAGISLGAPILGQLGPGGGGIPLEVQVYNEYSDKAGTDTTRIALGRWLSESVWVSVSSSIGQERDVEANLDYKINDQFAASAGYENDNEGQVGNVGVDLKFRLEF